MMNVNGLNGKITGDVTSLVGELGKRADANHDGRVSNDEFAQFLTQLINNQPPASAASNQPPSSAAVAQSPRDAAMAAIGRILAKFSPTPAGLGEALLSQAIDWLRGQGMPRVVLGTAAQNENAKRLFERLGFRPTMIEMTLEL